MQGALKGVSCSFTKWAVKADIVTSFKSHRSLAQTHPRLDRQATQGGSWGPKRMSAVHLPRRLCSISPDCICVANPRLEVTSWELASP